jgi:glycosyltransferase involved in cell wall biosynthesis
MSICIKGLQIILFIMKFSIVMGYYNRRQLLIKTLSTISETKVDHKDIEVIITDDASKEEHDISDLVDKYPFPIILLKVSPSEKKWINPVVAYNKAISRATGDWIIIQNPEVYHSGDFLYFLKTADTNIYWSMQVYGERSGWYSHPVHRPCFYHFCTAIHSSKLKLVGGFNNEMANGIDYDDNEILERIKRVCIPEYAPIDGVHQWHPTSESYSLAYANVLRMNNFEVFQKTRNNVNFIYCNPASI